ncbi:hypothetical protein BBH99_02875 [Chryseobacterium contaminans]|uniref:Uncharacterized protein n=1 Tax=Chryseobacterium contaminans TaxID=1423959 RepID=A0A1M7HAD8_9FLAO|nr:hypothetical protein [Chryseobacterium contaminans]OCA72678.1 hypothetical protein BBH99_02875 [Chryseobacterium contaminans]SHM25420.1 hypothetical protein SAMN05444407_111147 [Chryseobacterium contaminans]
MNKITDHFKYLSKLSAVFIFSLFKIYAIGILSTVITFSLGIYIMAESLGSSLGHSGTLAFLTVTVMAKPLSAGLFYLLMIAAPFCIAIFSTKYGMSRIISRLVQDHSKTILVPFIDKVVGKIKNNEPVVVRNSTDYALAKVRLVNEFKNSSENKILKRVLGYALNKVKFDELNLGGENVDFYDIIKTKLIEKLHELAEPSAMIFYIYIGLQWLSLILLYFLDI